MPNHRLSYCAGMIMHCHRLTCDSCHWRLYFCSPWARVWWAETCMLQDAACVALIRIDWPVSFCSGAKQLLDIHQAAHSCDSQNATWEDAIQRGIARSCIRFTPIITVYQISLVCDSSHPQTNHTGMSSSKSQALPFDQRWEPLKPEIMRLWLGERVKLKELISIMKERHDFHAAWVWASEYLETPANSCPANRTTNTASSSGVSKEV
jgi:hypothetical protein